MALLLCAHCDRHVRESEPRCPFCNAPREASATDEPSPEASVSLSRAAILLASAMALGACEKDNPLTREPQIAQPYGAPPQPPRPIVQEPQIAQPYGAPPQPQPEPPVVDSGAAESAHDAGSTRQRRASPPPVRRPPAVRPMYGAPASAYGGAPGMGLGEKPSPDDDE
jgi:hypothetical protein